MLSILIPTYNYDCHCLVNDLRILAEGLSSGDSHMEYEIIVADDGSTDNVCKDANRVIGEWEHCQYIELTENCGRAAIRNTLARWAHYEFLLFIDSDAEVCSSDFLHNYITSACLADVICGGVRNPEKLPSKEVSLRYEYEKSASHIRTLKFRKSHPHQYFTTFNFMIRRSLFLSIGFDEQCTDYGYEDALFGVELENKGIPIYHIDNPLIHLGIEQNDLFLTKTEMALRTLKSLGSKMQSHAQISRLAIEMEKRHLIGFIRIWHRFMGGLERKQLESKNPSLFIFKIYKLGYYASLN